MPVVLFVSIVRPTTTGIVVPSRPVSASVFASCLKPASDTAIGASTSCCDGRDGPSTTNAPVDLACIGRLVAAFEATTSSLSERAASAEKRADRAEIRADQAETRADRAEQALAGERNRADRAEAAGDVGRAGADALRDRLHGMQEQLADAHAALQAAATAEARIERAERDKEQVELGRETAEARADELRTRLDDMQVQLATRQKVMDCAFRWIVNTDSGDHERRGCRDGGSVPLTIFYRG